MPTAQPSSILAVLSAGLGDLIIAVPALAALRRRYPNARITVAVSSKTLPYAAACPYCDRAIALDASPTPRQLRLLLELRGERFDLAINFYEISTFGGMVKMRALFAAIAPVRSAGRDTDGRGSFFDIRLPDSKTDGLDHGAQYANLLELLGCTVNPAEKNALWISQKAGEEARRLLAENGIAQDSAYFGINPGSARKSRLWLPERFAETADAISMKYGMKAVITGGPGEEALAGEIASSMKTAPAVCAGKLSFEASLALVRRMRFLLTTHSSLMHAANSFSVPFAVLCGISDIRRDGPYSPDPALWRVIQGRSAGAELVSENEPSPAMAAIPARTAIQAAQELLEHYGAH